MKENASTEVLLARMRKRRLERPAQPSADDVFALRQALSYLKAASVLECFVLQELRPLAQEFVHPNPLSLLFEYVSSYTGPAADGALTLKLAARRTGLKELKSREAMLSALQVNPMRPKRALQTEWEEFLATGRFPDLSSLQYNRLARLNTIVSWTEGILPSLPSSAEVAAQLRRASAFEAFEHLVGDHFTGRTAELAALRQHVGTYPPRGVLGSAVRAVKSAVGLSDSPILLLHGIGGIGKSALLGQFLLENLLKPGSDRVPFAYLPFDLPTVRINEPHTILQEAARYLDLQRPGSILAAFGKYFEQYRSRRREYDTRRRNEASRDARIAETRASDTVLFKEFGKFLNRSISGTSRIVFVFDTFEEVQFAEAQNLRAFWQMLHAIHEQCPRVRFIVSGRTPPADAGPLIVPRGIERLSLAELPRADALELVRKLGVSDEDVAEGLVKQVGGNPLNLRLAARVVLEEAAAGKAETNIPGLNTRKFLFFRVDQELIQGQLYRRVLNHIHNEKVRALAHPGMVLRRVDPDIILRVLALVCNVPVKDETDARYLFNQLREEHSLVLMGPDGSIEYRPEIRSAVLRLLLQDRPDQVRRLREAAVLYYSTRKPNSDIEARAEEMLHRLALFEDSSEKLEKRWRPELASLLRPAVDELPDQAKAWLASRMDLEVPREVFANAQAADWERNVARKVQQALSHLDPEGALSLLRERSERTASSPLFALEAKAYLFERNYSQAASVLDRGIASVTSENRGRLGELLWLRSQVALLMGSARDADAFLDRAGDIMETDPLGIALAQILCQRLVLLGRELDLSSLTDQSFALQGRLKSAILRIPVESYSKAAYILSLSERLLGGALPASVSKAFGSSLRIGLTDSDIEKRLTSENLEGIDGYRHRWELESAPDFSVKA